MRYPSQVGAINRTLTLRKSRTFISHIGLLRILKVLLRNPIKLINLMQVFFSYIFLRGRIWGVPPVLILEPTTFCQLHCPLCTRESENFKRNNKHMDIGLIEKLLQECGNRLCVVFLYYQGEPFLHPEIMKIIELFKEYDVIVNISTNGNYKEDISKAVVRSGLDHIVFAIDGDTQEIYEKYRVGGSLNVLLSNIEKLSKAKKALGARNPFIEARLVALKHNVERIYGVKALLDKYGVDCFSVKRCFIDEEEFPDRMSFRSDSFRKVDAMAPRSCYYLWLFFSVLVNGEVSQCCWDAKGEFVLGNINTDSIFTILNKLDFIKTRLAVRHNPARVPMCISVQCDMNSENWYTVS